MAWNDKRQFYFNLWNTAEQMLKEGKSLYDIENALAGLGSTEEHAAKVIQQLLNKYVI